MAKMNGFSNEANGKKELLPKIKDVNSKQDKNELAIRKLKFCQQTTSSCQIKDATKDQARIKCLYLEDLIEYLKTAKISGIYEAIHGDIFTTISANIIHDFHPQIEENWEDNDDGWEEAFQAKGNNRREKEETINETKTENSEHSRFLKLIYKLFLVVLESPDFRFSQVKQYLDQSLVRRLIDQIANSPDEWERQYLERILRRIYAKSVRMRPFIRRMIVYSLLETIFDQGSQMATTKTFVGIGELLSLLEDVINGFKVPLKGEDRQLLFKVLMPLHRTQYFEHFHKKLSDRINQIVGLDLFLAKPIIEAMLKMWPKNSGKTEVIFLDELELIMNVIDRHYFTELVGPVFGQLSKCIASQHLNVSLKGLNFWKNERILSLISENSASIIQIISNPLNSAAIEHWNSKIRMTAKDVQNVMMELNWKAYNRCMANDVNIC